MSKMLNCGRGKDIKKGSSDEELKEHIKVKE